MSQKNEQSQEQSNSKSAVLGLQHLLAMYSGSILVPIMIAGALNYSATQLTYLISADIFMCGLATFLQLQLRKHFGIGLPVVLGVAFQSVAPLIIIGQRHGSGAMFGSLMVAGVFVILVSGIFSKIRKLFPPIVTGSVITTIGLSLIPVAIGNMGNNVDKPTIQSLMMIIIAIVSLVESTGVYLALADITGENLDEKRLRNGYRAEGFAVFLGGVFNTFPYTGFSQNVGLVQLSGIKTRKPIYFTAGFLIVLGLIPKFAAVAQLIPTPVLGGAMLIMFGMVATQGIRMLAKVEFEGNQNLLIAAVAIAMGVGFNSTNLFTALPSFIQPFVSNGIVMSTVSAIILNLVFNHGKKDELVTDETK